MWKYHILVDNELDGWMEVDYYLSLENSHYPEYPLRSDTLRANPGRTNDYALVGNNSCPCELRIAAYYSDGSDYGPQQIQSISNPDNQEIWALFGIHTNRETSLVISTQPP